MTTPNPAHQFRSALRNLARHIFTALYEFRRIVMQLKIEATVNGK